MPYRTTTFTRSAVAAAATCALGLGLASGASAAGAVVDRVAGDDRYGTAVELSKLEFKEDGSAGAVVLARGDQYADALAGSPLATVKDAPLLLTRPTALTPDTATEIERVLPEGGTVYVLGGTAALEPAVEEDLIDRGYVVERISGADRYFTALEVAEEIGEFETVLLATGTGFSDALSAGNVAAATGGVVMLSKGGSLTAEVEQFLAAQDDIVAVGGPAQKAAASANLPVLALFGDDRYATAVEVADHFFEFSGGLAGISLASGEDFPDALTAGAASGRNGHPVVLTRKDSLPEVTEDYAEAVGASPSTVLGYVVGGESAISPEVYDAFDAALRGAAPTE